MKKIFLLLLLLPFIALAQMSARETALQQEYYQVVVSETNDYIAQYLSDKKIYEEHTPKYYLAQSIITSLCAQYNTKCFPFYVTKEVVEAASMSPNGTLIINERVLNILDKDELTFILAHEYAHYYYEHSLKKSYFFAKTIIENGVHILDVERTIKMSSFLPGMREIHYEIEQEADDFAVYHLRNKNIVINCPQFFSKIIAENKLSLDQHKSSQERCSHF